MKKGRYIFAIMLALIIYCSVIVADYAIERSCSPYDYLCDEMRRRGLNDETPDALISQETIDEDRWVIFYKSNDGKAAIAIVEKAWFSYRLIRYASMAPDVQGYYCHAISGEDGYVHLLWGFADADVKEIFADGSPCKIIDAAVLDTRIFWIYGDFLAEPSKGPDFEIIREF